MRKGIGGIVCQPAIWIVSNSPSLSLGTAEAIAQKKWRLFVGMCKLLLYKFWVL